MVAYFKFQNNICMAVGAAAGLIIACLCYPKFIGPAAGPAGVFFIALAVFIGMHHLAYAYEAMGEYDKGLELLNSLEPEKLKLHTLVGCALVANQKLRLSLLKKDMAGAGLLLDMLKELGQTAQGRAPAVAANLKECIRLAEIWLGVLTGENTGDQEDRKYIEEEISLAKNPVHYNEMCGLLDMMKGSC